MKRVFLSLLLCVVCAVCAHAVDHVMAATRPLKRDSVPAVLTLSVGEAQDYAVAHNRSLRNEELAVQQAYAQRWQTIAAMLPSVDASLTYTNMFGYKMKFGGAQSDSEGGSDFSKYLDGLTDAEKLNALKFITDYPSVPKMLGNAMGGGSTGMEITMPNNMSMGVSASIGINGQAVAGAVMNTIAIQMKKLALEQSEDDLRASIRKSYASLLVLQDIVRLLENSYSNLETLYNMTKRSVEVGAAEQTQADLIRVRCNTLKDNISLNRRNITLAQNVLKVQLDVPASTELKLNTTLDEVLSPEAVLQILGEDFVLGHNLTYQTLEQNVRLAKAGVHMAAWAYGPTVGLSYQYSNQKYFGDGGMRMTPPNLFAVSVQMPLWSSGKRAAALTEKKIALESARNTLAETADNLGIQFQQLRMNLQNAYESYMTQRENLEVTERVFASTTNKFNYGSASNLELTNASNDVISAQSSYVQAVLTLIDAQSELENFLNK